jgi:5-dehydro-2-deoxygluconokinase
VAEGLATQAAAGAIVDDRYREEALFTLSGKGRWLARPVEVPGSRPLAFEAGPNLAARLRSWPAEHVVKCLSLTPLEDLAQLRALQEACIATGHELLVELLGPEPPIEEIYAAGVQPDWWKLAPPESDAAWERIAAAIARHDPHCRGVLLLGMEANEEALERGFALAARHAVCRGFAVGRSIFMDAARRWFAGACADADVVQEVARNYASLAALWRKHRGTQACSASAS